MATVHEYGKVYGAEPPSIGEYERKWLDNLKSEIETTSDCEINLLINLTWINIGEDMLNWIFEHGKPDNCKLWLAGTVDGNEWILHTHSMKYLIMCGFKYEFVGNAIDHFHTWMPSLMIKHNNLDDFNIKDIKYLFLSYNRKPRPWREQLVRNLIDSNLHTKGFITFEEGHFSEIDKQTKDYDQELHTTDRRFSRPEDILTVGGLDIWNSCYSVIVSETELYDAWQLSEKTWKPLMGLRPYFLNSNKGIVKILEKLNIYTPAMLFKNSKLNDCSIEEIIKQLKIIDNPFELYQSQLDMLTHNQKRFIEIANSDPTKILNWSQSRL